MTLAVPQPALAQDGGSGTAFSAAKPITITCAPVFADGTALDARHATAATYVLFRQPLGGVLQAWNPAAKAWQPADPPPAGDPMFVQDETWTALLIGAGAKDAGGNPLFDPALSASYAVACAFAGTDGSGAAVAAAGPRGASFTVTQPGADQRAGVLTTPPDPGQATELQIYLRDASLATRATVTLTSSGGDYTVTLAAGGSTVALAEDGTIALSPAGAGTVRVTGQLAIEGSLSLNGVVRT